MSPGIVAALFASDAARIDAWRAVLDEHVHIRIGSREPALGFRSALCELAVFLAGVGSFGGSYREVWVLSDSTVVETEIVCRARKGGHTAVVPCALVFRTGGGPKLLDVRFYLDPAPVLGGEQA
jgi:hypothetical protein